MIVQWVLIAAFALGAAFSIYLAITPVGSRSSRQQDSRNLGTDLAHGAETELEHAVPSRGGR